MSPQSAPPAPAPAPAAAAPAPDAAGPNHSDGEEKSVDFDGSITPAPSSATPEPRISSTPEPRISLTPEPFPRLPLTNKHLKHAHHQSVISTTSSYAAREKRFTFSSTFTDLEAQNEFDGDVDPPQKRFAIVRFAALNVYRRLFSLAFIGNIIPFIYLLVRGAAPLDLVNASAVNLAVCGLCRQPLVINALFLTFGSIPRTAPIRIRRLACKIFHLGGVHSGTGVAACLWYIGFAALYTYHFVPSPVTIAALVLIWLVLAFLLAIIICAYPAFRFKRHDWFELTHRFSNWIILVFFWVLLFLLASTEPSMGAFFLHLPAFWILIVLTVATIHPWMLLRRVPVVPEALSPHAVRLHFSHDTVNFGQGISVAKHPLADWHSFASFTDRHDSPDTKFSCLVSKVGDWTRGAINDQPTHLWKRGIPTYGIGYVFRMFPRIIVVTTGSGIGPCLSFLGDDNRPAMRVVWQTKSPMRTYGPRVLDLVKRMDPEPLILDTTHTGRVEMLPLVLNLFKEFEAEAVCVISNVKMTKNLVFALETRGIPAYGPIFDS